MWAMHGWWQRRKCYAFSLVHATLEWPIQSSFTCFFLLDFNPCSSWSMSDCNIKPQENNQVLHPSIHHLHHISGRSDSWSSFLDIWNIMEQHCFLLKWFYIQECARYHHISSNIIIYHHVSPYIIISSCIIIYHHKSKHIIIYHHTSSNIIIYYFLYNQISSNIIKYHHILPNIIIYYQISSYNIMYHQLSSNIIIYCFISSNIIKCHHISSYTIKSSYIIIYHHVSSCIIICIIYHHLSGGSDSISSSHCFFSPSFPVVVPLRRRPSVQLQGAVEKEKTSARKAAGTAVQNLWYM